MRFVFNGNVNEPAKNDLDVFQEEALRSMRSDLPYEAICSNMCMGLAGETGETIDIFKKHIYQGKVLDINDVIEEIGDILLNVFSILQIHEDKKDFTTTDVINDLCEKLYRRHAHVFGNVEAATADDAVASWNSEKEKERKANSIKAVLEHVSTALPPLEKSYEIQKKLSRYGFEWESIDDVIDKVYEEMDEVKEAISENNRDHIEDELGDVFLTLVNLARYLKVRPDQALERANYKITSRFVRLCELAGEKGVPVDKDHLAELDELWNEVKRSET